MKSKELQTFTNNKIRSFLTSPNKYGTRSLSTSDSCPQINLAKQPQKTYIDFRRVNREKIEKTNLQIKLNQFNKRDKRDIKLYKCTINKHKQNEQKQEKYEDNCDLLKMVRNLKEKVLTLQMQNKILIQQRQEDSIRLIKQEQIIRNLQQALSLNRSHHSYSFGIYQNHNNLHNCEQIKTTKSIKYQKQFQQKCLQLKINKLQLQNNKLKQNYQTILEQNKKLKYYSDNQTKDSSFFSSNIQNRELINLKSLQKALNQIEASKLKEIQEIDMLLFGSGF